MGNLEEVEDQNDFPELESKQSFYKHIFQRGRYPIPPTFLHRPLPSSQPCRVRQAQCSDMAREPVDTTQLRLGAYQKGFLEK